jgi:hypothetical protein
VSNYFVRYRFDVPLQDIGWVLDHATEFHRTDVRVREGEVKLADGTVACDKNGKPITLAVVSDRDELRDVPLDDGLGFLRFEEPIFRNVMMKVCGGPSIDAMLVELKRRLNEDPDWNHRVENQYFNPEQVVLNTLEETRGLHFDLPNAEKRGTKAFVGQSHRLYISYDPKTEQLEFEVETESTMLPHIHGRKLGRESVDHEKAFVAAAHNILRIVTKPVIDAGYKPKPACRNDWADHFTVSPLSKSSKKKGFLSTKDMSLHYVKPER